MTYNVCVGGEENLAEIESVVGQVAPDVLAILEASERGVPALAQRLDMPHYVVAPSRHPYPRDLGVCVAWVARKPFQLVRDYSLPALAKTLLRVSLDGFSLFATHLASRHEEAEHPRAAEMKAIAEVLRSMERTVLAGDLNTVAPGDPTGDPPPGVTLRGEAAPEAQRDVLAPLLENGYIDCYRAIHPDAAGYTYPADQPWLRLDYVFASPDLAPHLTDCDAVTGVMAERASDHLPVWAEFRDPAA
jgi:exodeoxyribonuclease III